MRGSKSGLGVWVAGAVLSVSASAGAQSLLYVRPGAADPPVAGGMSSGPVQATALSPSCSGFIPAMPQHRVVLQGPAPFLRVWAHSGGDATLVVRAPSGQVFCADDTWGNDPGVDVRNAVPGAYDVFVGSFSAGAGAPYNLGVSQSRAATPSTPMAGAYPPNGGVVVAPGGGPPTVVVPGNPPPVVLGQPPGSVIVGQQPGGVIGGEPPGGVIMGQPSPGVIVQPPGGGYGGNYGAAYGTTLGLNTGFMPDPRVVAGVAGGPVSAQAQNPACRGYISPTPNQTLALNTPFRFLRLWVRSQGDTTLVVRAPSGQMFCADDTYGDNPGLDLNGLPPGMYQVFVGTYSAGRQFPYELGVSELASSTPMGGGAVPGGAVPGGVVNVGAPGGAWGGNAMPPGTYGSVSLAAGFMPDPQLYAGVMGGPVNASTWSRQCRGSIPAQPNHTVYLASPFQFLRIYASSPADATLVVRGPRGELYCADDTFGTNPGLDLNNAAPGVYQVFVGSYNGTPANYTLGFTENPGVRP